MLAVFLTLSYAAGAENSSAASDQVLAESKSLSAEVAAIFQVKCIECHDASVARPRGDFGYVRDLARVAGNRDWIIPGEPEKSELYLMVQNDEMPGDEATVPPLTPQEKDIVRRWIETGAQVAATSVGTANEHTNSSATAVEPRTENLTVNWRIVRFLGQFHPPSSHFPIALLIVALPAEYMWKRTRKASWKAIVRFCVMAGAASAIATGALGWCNATFSSYTGASANLLAWHRWIGTATALWAIATAWISEIAHKGGNPRLLRYCFRAILLVGIVLVSISGYLGASLIYGLHHFVW